MYFSQYKASVEFKVTFSFWNVVFKRIKQLKNWNKLLFQIGTNQIVLVSQTHCVLAMEMASQCFAPVFFPTACFCVILTHTYHLYHYFTMFRQIHVAGIGSEMEIWGCHQPGLKWLSFNGLCEIGGRAQFTLWTCPHCKLVGFAFPILGRPAAVVLLVPTAEEGDEASLCLHTRLSGLYGHDPGGLRKGWTLFL